MQRRKFSEELILGMLKEAEAGTPVAELLRRYGVGETTFYKWKNRYQGMTPDSMARLRELELENSRLKRLYAELSLEYDALKDIVRKKL
jgi:putative transposase